MMASEHAAAHVEQASALDRRKMLILYGSETGNSEESASDIESMARRLHFRTRLEEMNYVELSDLLSYSFVVFVISTTGQGDLPKNARTFWKSLLRKRLPPDCLSRVSFTTFGLGDSSYFQYNWAARKLHKRLEQLGAVEFLPRGEADERHEEGIDGTFLPWCLTLRTYLERECPLPPGLLPLPPHVQLAPKFTLELVEQDLSMDPNDDRLLSSDAMVPKGRPRFYDISHTAEAGPAQTRYEVDNQGRRLDREAALFSHVDSSPDDIRKLKFEHDVEDRSPDKYILARVSNRTAQEWPGGVDKLDRPNVLRDSAIKYSLDSSNDTTEETPPASLLPIPDSWQGMVEGNTRLTPGSHWQDVRLLTLRIWPNPSSNDVPDAIVVNPGDSIVIYPKNFPRDVQALIDLMGWGEVSDRPFRHVPHGDDLPCRTPRNCTPLENSTLRELLIHNYDITCIPRRTFFTQIAMYTQDPTHKERLREFADPGHSDEFWDYTSRPRRSILEVLQDFPSVRVPYQHIPSVFPVIRGREYSLANTGYSHYDPRNPDDIILQLVVALVKYKTVLRKTRQGLCSRYIASLKPDTPICITRRANVVPRDAEKPSIPILAIAAGTGIAPIRSLFHERAAVEKLKGSGQRAESVLFYGGRNKDADFYFEEEWERFGIKVVTAFSRDQPSKIYVQDRLLENYKTVCRLVVDGATICLCGSSGKMPEAVRLALYDCLVKGELADDREQAKAMIHKKGYFWEEVW
ncbi:hypothetical protein F4777DRAFT_534347 [Nemania sp. FL0916]|nr:hypothetical protein F4777DRAFT_534347 [Nemania sp. FL0916]